MRKTYPVILCAGLMIAACGPKDTPSTELPMKLSAAPELVTPSQSVIDDASADSALDSMGFAKEQDGFISWGDQKGASGNYQYKDLAITSTQDDAAVQIGTLDLYGVRMEGGRAVIDSAIATGVIARNDTMTLDASRMAFANPDGELVRLIAWMLDDRALFEDGADIDNPSMPFDAIEMDDVKISPLNAAGDDGLTFNTLRAGKTQDDGFRIFLDDFAATSDDGSLSLSRLDIDGSDSAWLDHVLDENSKDSFDRGSFIRLLGSGNASVSDLKMETPDYVLSMPSFAGTGNPSGNQYNTGFTLPSLTIASKIKDAPVWLDFETLNISAEMNSRYDQDTQSLAFESSRLTLDDGFELKMNADLSGVSPDQGSAQGFWSGKDELEDFSDVSISGLNITLKDNSIVDRIARNNFTGTEEDLQRYKTGMKGMMYAAMFFLPKEDRGPALQAATALGGFMEGGRTLEVSLSPDTPITLDELERIPTGEADYQSLNMKIKVKK